MYFVKVLGSGGTKTQERGTTSFLVSRNITIDGGNIIASLGEDALRIDHIFLTHTHLDHIADIPYLLDSFFEKREKPLTIYASKQSIENLKQYLFNNDIWPDFTQINLLNSSQKVLEYKEINLYETINIDEYYIEAIPALHIDGACGFIIYKEDRDAYLISGDTSYNEELINILNQNKKIKNLFIECSFPNRLDNIAQISQHLTPNSLYQILKKLNNDDLNVFIYHIKQSYFKELQEELQSLDLKIKPKILNDGDLVCFENSKIIPDIPASKILERVMDINLQLSSTLDKDRLYEMILTLIRDLTKSDAGTLYILSEDKKHLNFTVVQNDTLKTYLGGKEEKISWQPLSLYLEDGSENKSMVAAVSALENRVINIEDAYYSKEYNFEGTKKFDQSTGYRSKSMLVSPLINHENDVIGVIQLINKNMNQKDNYFTKDDEKIITSLSYQAAMALTNTQLILGLEGFLEAFVTTIAGAIDAKSSHTSTHITKMAILAPLIAQAIDKDQGIYKEIEYSENDFKEIELAAKLHDVGKISMPEFIVDKATKLEKIFDRIELIRLRVEIIKRDLEVEFLKGDISQEEFEKKIELIEDELEFIERSNKGGEFLRDEDAKRIENLLLYQYKEKDSTKSLITCDELRNLLIKRGTLTDEEKAIMNNHATLSYEMLSNLPFPKKYSNVMHIAVNHHEKLNGKGYPRGLEAKDLVLEDRILILADIFEALTSNDRPYKGVKKLSEVFRILDFMAKDGEIDKDLLEFFKQSDALKEYAQTQLLKEQLDV